MIVLGIGINWHDSSAALLADGEVVAAAEQERFSRRKHAHGELPIEAARFCLEAAGLPPSQVDLVAYPWSLEALRASRWAYVRRTWRRLPRKALRMALGRQRRERRRRERLHETLRALDLPPEVEIAYVEHHLAHASSAYHFSGFDEAAVLTLDGMGEVASCVFAVGARGRLRKLAEIQKPDSLGLFYAAMTDYLGFEVNDGEYKVMGMAPYGDPRRADLSGLVEVRDGDLRLDLDCVWSPRDRRVPGRKFGRRLVERLGPARDSEAADEPYVHLAAATQALFEESALALVEHHLGESLARARRLCFAGGCSLNVALNGRLIAHPLVDELYVPPGAGDSGVALGAASYAAARRGERIAPLRHAYLGPAFGSEAIARELSALRVPFVRVEDPAREAARLLADGEVVAWFQGAMEWGPRALGHRSILGHPGRPGTADAINERIKYRERWRPFCPSILEEHAPDLLGSKHPSPYMTYAFRVTPGWRERVPEVVHVDGTVRPQLVSRAASPLFHRLLCEFHARTGLPCVLNTSLNRRGEPLACTPRDALAVFQGSGLEHLFLEDLYVTKRAAAGPA
jgi:carbamoyltransferase